MKKAQETKKVKKSGKVTLIHQIAAYGLTIIILTVYLGILKMAGANTASIWAILGAIVIAVIVLPILQNLIYPDNTK